MIVTKVDITSAKKINKVAFSVSFTHTRWSKDKKNKDFSWSMGSRMW